MTIVIESGIVTEKPRSPKRQHRCSNPLGLLIAIIRRAGKDNEIDHREAFKKQIMAKGFEPYLEKLIEEWFSLKYSTASSAANPQSMEDIQQERARRLKEEEAERQQQKDLKQNAKTIIGQRLLEMMTPKGIPLGDCTGAECRSFGGFYQMIAVNVGAKQLVRRALKPEQIANFAKQASMPIKDTE